MFSSNTDIQHALGDFCIEDMMLRYSCFIPRLYNWCRSLGFEAGKIAPSRAFCSDESQGYPLILMVKHFGAFPFNHGRVGGIVSISRHGPHAAHGKDMLIIQASHVGYDPHTGAFGRYRRLQTEQCRDSSSCGKISHTLRWYQQHYDFAKKNILLERLGENYLIHIDNQILNQNKVEGLFLNLELLVSAEAAADGQLQPLHSRSTAKTFMVAESLLQNITRERWPQSGSRAIGRDLGAELFRFNRNIDDDVKDPNHLELNLLPAMAYIVTSPEPMLTAAKVNTQVEFDRVYRSIVNEPNYKGKNLLFIAGLNIDISPEPDQVFPLTKFVPWAAYVQTADGLQCLLEQQELFDTLEQQSSENPDSIDLEDAIRAMEEAQGVHFHTLRRVDKE